MGTKEEILKFIEVARKRLENKDANILSSSIGKWFRYFDFLQILLRQYGSSSDVFIKQQAKIFTLIKERADSTGKVGPDQEINRLFDESSKISTELHLSIESFYLFSKILLDRIADSVDYFFGIPFQKNGSSHSQLETMWAAFAVEAGITVTSTKLAGQMKDLKTSVTKRRNNEIEHDSEPRRLFGTTWGGADGKTKISSNILYPTEGEIKDPLKTQRSIGDLNKIFTDLEEYMMSVVQLLSENFNKFHPIS